MSGDHLWGDASWDDEWTIGAHFGVTIDAITQGGTSVLGLFQKVSGLGVTVGTEDVVEGGQNDYVHKLPGPLRWQDLELERGVVSSDTLLDWLQKTSGTEFAKAGNKVTRHDGSIKLYGFNNAVLRKWEFSGGMPVSWTGPSFDADSDQIATEKLVIAHSGIRRVS